MSKVTLRTRLVLSLIIMLGLATGLVVPLMLKNVSDTIARAEERQLQGFHQAFEAAVGMSAANGQALALLVAEMPEARNAFAAGDRARLLELFKVPFDALKSALGVDQMQFHQPPAISFLRLHLPAKFGDDLGAFRQTVVDANRRQEAVIGLENGVGGLGIRAVIPLRAEGKHLGTVEFGMNFGQALADSFKRRFGTDLAIYAPKITAHSRAEAEIRPVALTRDQPFFGEAERRQGLSGETLIRHGLVAGRPVAALLAPVLDYRGAPAAVVEIVMDATPYAVQYAAARNQALIVAAGVLLLGAFVALMLANGITRSLTGLTGAMRGLAGGDTAQSVPSLGRGDEIGEMARAVEVFKRNAIERDRLSAERQVEEDRKMRRQGALEHLTRGFQGEVGEIVQSVEQSAHQLRAVAHAMAAVAEETKGESTIVAAAAEQAAVNVQTVAAATEQLAASECEIARTITRSSEVARNAVTDAERITGIVLGLSEATARIGDVVGLIEEIAAQTNLLALNATIEAARAGDAGKGFAVVAGEVKQLASQTAKATGEIGTQIAAVQAVTRDAVTAIGEIAQTIGEIDQTATTIAAAVEEQTVATAEIARNVSEASRGTREVTSSIGRVNQAAIRTGETVAQVLETADLLITRATGLASEVSDFLSGIDQAGDRRRHRRVEMHLEASIDHDGEQHHATTLDVSLGGARLDRDIGCGVGAPVTVALSGLPPVHGQVVGVSDGQSRVMFEADPGAERVFAQRLER